MENFEKTLELFLAELSKYSGSAPTIKIDYSKKTIRVIESASGFMRQLYSNDRICMHLSSEGATVEFFK